MQRVNKQCNMLQKHVYTAGGERIEQFTDRTAQSGGNGGLVRMLYVHEDIVGNTMYYTKDTGSSFCELRYDVWGFPDLSGKLQNNDNGNFAAATFEGHIYDTVIDVYFAEARFYDANNRTFMSTDPVKDGLNWYKYAGNNPTTFFDPTGLFIVAPDKTGGTEMKPGAAGADVVALQEALNVPKTPVGSDYAGQKTYINSGLFDEITEKAIRKYQEENSLNVTGTANVETWLDLGLDYNTTLGEEFGLSHMVNPDDKSKPTINVAIRKDEQGQEEIVMQYFPVFYIQEPYQYTFIDEYGQELTYNLLRAVDDETYEKYVKAFYQSLNESWGNFGNVTIQGIDAKVILEMDKSMRKGTGFNNNVHIILEAGQNIVPQAFIWSQNFNLGINLRESTIKDIVKAARHEFGHVLGNFDTYGYNQNPFGEFFFTGLEHKYPNGGFKKENPHILNSVSWNNIMDFLTDEIVVEDINIEMALYAFSENNLQQFYPSILGDTSNALYR